MPWTYQESTGNLTNPGGKIVACGYSGKDLGKNNPDMQSAVGVGPIPCGDWYIDAPYDSPNTGPYTLPLRPVVTASALGRSGFRIHGDSISDPGNASHGCIILPRYVRTQIWASGDRKLKVVE